MDIVNSWLLETPIAHRGLHSSGIAENSLSAFSNAIKKNYAIELDVRFTSDKQIIVFHDNTLARMTGADGYVENCTFPQIEHLSLKGTVDKIPLLTTALKLINGQVPVLIEIKNEQKIGEFEKALLKILSAYSGEFAIQSFNAHSLEWFKKNAPDIVRGQLCSFDYAREQGFLKHREYKTLKILKISEPQFLNYNFKNLPNRFVKKHKDLPLIAYTLTNQKDYIKSLKLCDNVVFENFIPTI